MYSVQINNLTPLHLQWGLWSHRMLTGTSFLKLTPVGRVIVMVFATVVVVEVVTIVLTWPARGAFAGTWAWAWAWASAILPGVVIEPCIFTGGSLDCCPYSMYYNRVNKHIQKFIYRSVNREQVLAWAVYVLKIVSKHLTPMPLRQSAKYHQAPL